MYNIAKKYIGIAMSSGYPIAERRSPHLGGNVAILKESQPRPRTSSPYRLGPFRGARRLEAPRLRALFCIGCIPMDLCAYSLIRSNGMRKSTAGSPKERGLQRLPRRRRRRRRSLRRHVRCMAAVERKLLPAGIDLAALMYRWKDLAVGPPAPSQDNPFPYTVFGPSLCGVPRQKST